MSQLPVSLAIAHSQQQTLAQPVPQSQSFHIAPILVVIGLAETPGLTLIHFGLLYIHNKQVLDLFFRNLGAQPILFKVFLFECKSAKLFSEYEYTEVIMRLEIGDRVLIGISCSSNPSAVSRIIERRRNEYRCLRFPVLSGVRRTRWGPTPPFPSVRAYRWAVRNSSFHKIFTRRVSVVSCSWV